MSFETNCRRRTAVSIKK